MFRYSNRAAAWTATRTSGGKASWRNFGKKAPLGVDHARHHTLVVNCHLHPLLKHLRVSNRSATPTKRTDTTQERLSDLIGPYWDTYGIVYTVLQPLLDMMNQFGSDPCPSVPAFAARDL